MGTVLGRLVPNRWNMDLTTLTKYDPVAAHLAAYCSYYAYYDNAAEWFTTILGASSVRRILADPTTARPQGYILELPECFVVVFAGTTNAQQIYNYLLKSYYWTPERFPTAAGVGSVWGHWADQVDAGWTEAMAGILGSKKCIFTGHSAGAAIAACFRFQVSARNGDPSNRYVSYLFGCPRLGNRAAANACPDDFNIFQKDDIVPKLPHYGYAAYSTLGQVSGTKRVMPFDGFVNHGRLGQLIDDGTVLGFKRQDTAYNPSVTPLEFDVASTAWDVLLHGDTNVNFRGVRTRFNDLVDNHSCEDYLTLLEKKVPVTHEEDGEFAFVSKRKELSIPADPAPLTNRVTTPAPSVIPTVDAGALPLTRRHHH